MSKKDNLKSLIKRKEGTGNIKSVHDQLLNGHESNFVYKNESAIEIVHNSVHENVPVHERDSVDVFENKIVNESETEIADVNIPLSILDIAKKAKQAKPKKGKKKLEYLPRTFRIREDLLEAIDTLYTEHGEKKDLINKLLIDHFNELNKNLK